MQKEYIEREELIAEFKRLELGENSFIERVFADGVYAIIEQFPAADVAPVRRGRWIEEDGIQICSECGEEHEWEDYRAPYCDTCGAKMAEKAAKEEACQNGGN